MKDAYLYDAVRTPRGKGKPDGSLHEVSSLRLSSETLNQLKARNNLGSRQIEDIVWGNVTQVGEQGGCLARSAVLHSEFDDHVPAVSINRFCASGLEAVNIAANHVRAGSGDAYIAGGVESMSRVPMGSDGGAIAVDPDLTMKAYFVPQGISADIIATKYGFSRDDCDAYAVESQCRANRAEKESRFDRSRFPVRDLNGLTILDHDEQIRANTDMQGLGALTPSFREIGENMPGFDAVAIQKYPDLERINHVHHAGNSSGISDGAAAVLIGNAEFGKGNNLVPRAVIRAATKVGCDPTIMLTGPVPATEKVLKAAGMTIDDVDLFEVNEAFASVVLLFLEHFGVDHSRVNVNGGAIAMGHPIGATGAMILGTLIDELERADMNTGLATLCIGSGMGVATIIERVDGFHLHD